MATRIFYFSGTGNSLVVAKDLATELGDAELVPIPKAISSGINLSADKIGIVFPVYEFGVPLIVADFIDKMPVPEGEKYFFAVTTMGGMAGTTLPRLAKLLKKKGIKLSAGFKIRMPGNFTPLYEAPPENVQNKMFEEAKKRVKEIAEIVKSGKEHKLEKDPAFFNLLGDFIYSMGSPRIRESSKNFWLNENCTGCGTCERVCPKENVILKDKKPEWKRDCELCMACLQWCPSKAIEYGKKTPGRKRYTHPEIKAKDIIEQSK